MRIVSLFLLLLISCEKKQKKEDFYEEYNGMQLTESRTKTLRGNITYTFDLPDTLKVNQAYDIVFKFDSPFDTIVDPMVDTINFRTITMFYYNPIKVGERNEDIAFKAKDSILIPNKLFTLGNFKIEDKGKYLFFVVIHDEIMYNYFNDKGKRDSVHFDRIFEEIKKEVVVIE
ncbi:hypothetical protein H4K35_04755 [Myroides sp. NP-2]|uniref:hypothetical protein n=1 Tax=Myroides sp. NP-2 TaxID=2759945 RepID=UPI0015FC6839|nr:hypothetical protein [Myroides sp. NP-2]MBB1149451.1 hypothetical protein [Myroides sp. NP-2]